MDRGYTLAELLAVEASRYVRDDEMNFVGIGTGGQSWIMAVGMPTVAVSLAQHKHAPNATLMIGPVLDPLLDDEYVPDANWEYDLIYWPCRSQIPLEDALGIFRLGKVGLSFASAAQVDIYGNLNIGRIGTKDNMKVRLPGCLAQTDHGAYAKRICVTVRHNKRTLVEHVDFISCAGNENRKGLPGGGPALVLTDKAVMDFDENTGKMRLKSIHQGVTLTDVIENTGFDLIIPERVPRTEPPTSEELKLIRLIIDPKGKFLEARITQEAANLN